MAKERVKLIDDDLADVLASLPKGPSKPKNTVSKAEIKKVSEEAKFVSREVPPQPEKRKRRLYRTGRNVQFATKLSKETHDSIYDTCEQQGWLVAETIENAMAALQEKIAKPKK